MSELMPVNELVVLRALLFAGECLLASLLLPLLGFAVTAGLRRRAALRHLVWTTLFGVLAVLPFVALLLPARQVVSRVAAPVPALMDAPMAATPVAALPPESLLTPGNIVLLLVGLWLAGLAFHALRLSLGGLGLMRLRRRSVPFASEITTGCTVRLSHGEEGPSTFGILRPLILLPRSAEGWPAARLEAVLRHEAAHVARRDTLSQFIARLVCALYWLNPLLWLGLRAQRRAAEIAADDEVLAGGMMPSLYADALVELAAESRGVAPGIAMATPPLAQRVQSVLETNIKRTGVTRMDMAKTVSFGLAATLLLGVARFDIAVAQDAPARPARPAPMAPPAPPAPRVNVERRLNLTVERPVNADVQRAIEAQAAAVKAQADVNVANARARAAAETDPAQKEVFRRIAEEKAADAAVTKANADLTVAQARDAARREAGAYQRAAADTIRVREAQGRIAETRVRVSADAERARDMVERGRLRTTRSPDRNGPQTDFGISFQPDPLEIDTGPLNAAMVAAMQRPEVRRVIDEAVTLAMGEARKAINSAIAQALAEATAATQAAPPAPPRALTITPVPPALTITPVPPAAPN